MADLLNGKYENQISKFMVFDARYPYEYHGGHIANAENVYEKESLFDKLFNQSLVSQTTDSKPVVLIFHCEFSSERGPRL